MINFLRRKIKWNCVECDYLNSALRILLKEPDKNQAAIKYIYFALRESDGYFFDDVKQSLLENFRLYCEEE